jgi:hypothetical protein
MAKLNPAATLPTGSRDALEIFDERYLDAIGTAQPPTWVDELGEAHDTPALETKYPMSLLSLRYEETIDERGRFKSIGEKMVDLSVVQFDEGLEVEIMKLITNSFVAGMWEQAPARFIQAEQMFRLKTIASALVANTLTCGWDGLPLFHDAHLANGKDTSAGTFDNLQASAKNVADLANIEAEIALMSAGVLDTQGDLLGACSGNIAIGVTPSKYHALKNLLKQDFVPSAAGTATMRNPYHMDQTLTVIRMDQVSVNPGDANIDANDWFIFDLDLIARGVVPWVLAKLALPNPGFDDLSLRRYEPANSDYARSKGVVAVSSRIFYGHKFLFPHAVRKVAGA